MTQRITRRNALSATGMAVAAGAMVSATRLALAADAPVDPNVPTASRKIKIVAVCGSPRKGKTTAAGLKVVLDAARAVAPDRIEVELIELAGRKIDSSLATGVAPEPGQRDDFPAVLAKIAAPNVAGIVAGSPVYFGDMSALLKMFFERCTAVRGKFGLSNKIGGALAVAGARNGGQEQTIRSIHMALFGQEMILVGDGRPTAHAGATLWNNGKDDVSGDEPGLATARNLGRRVAEVALLVHGR